ncbi:MAG TPA: TetR/AcrR family transcriptional regulator [Solirubrobacteraceae bacterium]|nr:TetR/AcrR family transcriptional regulator [Solirubrobacteraceae bacterium]
MARNVTEKPLHGAERPPSNGNGVARKSNGTGDRYRPLPTGTHGLDPELVKRDQCERLQKALVELIADKGYPAVRIVDLAKLAHVSQPTFYSLYADKEDLFMSAYTEVAERTGTAVLEAYRARRPHEQRVIAAVRAWTKAAAGDPEGVSLLVTGAFGAGAKALERRRRILRELERNIYASRDERAKVDPGDLVVKAILGGIREVTATRLLEGRASELPGLTDELAAWAICYPRRLPAGLAAPPASRRAAGNGVVSSERARRAEGRLPSGRSDLPRQFIVKSQRERIVDATAAIVAERGLAALTVPEIARRANVSHQTFYDIYSSKHDAFLGALKVGLHRALTISVEAYQAHEDDWPRAARAGLQALLEFLASEPAHANLSLVGTFAACPEALEIRSSTLRAFAAYFGPAYELARDQDAVPAIAGEAIAGGIWQVLHYYVESDSIAELPAALAQICYFTLTPFLGPAGAAAYSLAEST